ncbi:MAG TPA: hypothetical protein VMD76_00425 [Candidatus Sulfotelmatobacter sp.]|nr:hypothetical protein [Candidatus Sulfotelmatobacter sp.]
MDGTNAANAQGFNACDHVIGTAKTGTVSDAGRASEKVGAAAIADGPAGKGSAMITRICGAPQCGQNGLPSSTI